MPSLVRIGHSDRGFALLEVIVAFVIVGTAAAGVASLMTISAASTRAARTQSWAAMLAGDKLEQLRGLTWRFDASGAARSDTDADISVEPPRTGGPGLSASPIDSLDRSVPGFVEYVDEAGRWVGTGAPVPAGAVYLRRWNIQPLPADPAHSLILQVRVTTRAGAGQADARVASVLTRKAG